MSRVAITRYEAPGGAWEMAGAAPDPRLAHLVDAYQGYAETGAGPVRRLEMPFPKAALILGFGPEIAVSTTGEAAGLEPGFGAFLAGLSSGPALVESRGQTGVQANLTPLGAFQLFGVPMSELTGRAVRLSDLAGAAGRELVERLRDLPSWDARFDFLDAVFLRALAANRPPSEAIAWAWRQVSASPETVSISRLAETIGWSHKHLIDRFRAEVGVTPRLASRIVRFHNAMSATNGVARPDWARIAVDCGFYDQAHLAREFRALGRCTPGEFWQRKLADGGVFGGELPSPAG